MPAAAARVSRGTDSNLLLQSRRLFVISFEPCTLEAIRGTVPHAGSLRVLVKGEAVRPEPVPLTVSGGAGCSLAWLAVGGAPALRAGAAASVLVETRDASGQRILHVRAKADVPLLPD